MTSEIQQNRYDQLLRRVGGIIGPGSKVSEVLTELFPVLDVESVPSELLLLSGTRICMSGGVIAAAAGEAPKMGLFNPADSGHILTLTECIVTSTAATVVRWGVNTNELAAQTSVDIFADTRLGLGNPVGRFGQESAVALANANAQSRILSSAPFRIAGGNDIMVLSPGFGFEIGLSNFAITLTAAMYWRERVALSSELNLPT